MIPVSQPRLSGLEARLVQKCFNRNRLTQGPMVAMFERRFARYLGVEHAVAVTSGTTALHLALAALGVGPGDEVIVPDLTYVATVNAVAYVGATPVLVDIDRNTWGIDPICVGDAITSRTKAIIAVDLYGRAYAWKHLREEANGIPVIEDAAQGLGGSTPERFLGTLGDLATFSFYGNKVITTGEGGMVVTDNERVAERLRHLRGMATRPGYYHDEVGFNFRMSDVTAAIGVGQMHQIGELVSLRRQVVAAYSTVFGHTPRWSASSHGGRDSLTFAPWLFTLPVKQRARLIEAMKARGIETRPSFVPMHHLPMYIERSDSHFPVATELSQSLLSLPTYPDLSFDDACWIGETLLDEESKL